MKTFLVARLEKVFVALSWVSYFHWLRVAIKRWLPKWWGPGVVELWVLAATALSALALVAGPVPAWVLPLIALRVWEIMIYQANVLLFDPLRAELRGDKYERHSYRRSLVLAFMNYAEILLWFAAVYLVLACEFAVKPEDLMPNTSGLALYYSVITMSTLGYGDITPASTLTYALATVQTVIGLFLVLLIFSQMVNLLPRPGTKEKGEQQDTGSD